MHCLPLLVDIFTNFVKRSKVLNIFFSKRLLFLYKSLDCYFDARIGHLKIRSDILSMNSCALCAM